MQCKTKLRLSVSDRQGKHAFAQEILCLQGIFSYINERGTSSLDCKHEHMLLKTELRLTNLADCTVCRIKNS